MMIQFIVFTLFVNFLLSINRIFICNFFFFTAFADPLDHATGLEKRELLAAAAGNFVSFYIYQFFDSMLLFLYNELYFYHLNNLIYTFLLSTRLKFKYTYYDFKNKIFIYAYICNNCLYLQQRRSFPSMF